MKFRYKVLLINITIIAIALSVAGFLMMSRQNTLMTEAQIKNAVTENNLVQSVIEYSLLDIINNDPSSLEYALPDISEQVSAGMLSDTSDLYVRYDFKTIFSTEEGQKPPVNFSFTSNLQKKYLITERDGKMYIYVTSSSKVDDKTLNIITRRDISDMKFLMNKSIHDFRLFTVIMLFISGFLVYIISMLLTRPLEKLNTVTDDFSQGNFTTRSDIHSGDEIGLLSDKFNHMADAVEDHIDELNDMVHRRDQFVADFTHEIKTPMTTIIGYADTIRSVDLPREDEVKAASYIFSEGRRLEQMSSHLFDLIYLKDGEIPKQPVNTQALGNAVVDTILPAIEAAGLKLTYNFENATITGDSSLLKTVFINILDNARKASSEGGEISFTGIKTDTYQFIVEDHGIGISEEDISKICDEFYMVDKSRSRSEGGAGLGMSLVSTILNEHKADLKIESKLGEGTKMTVTFDQLITNSSDEEMDDEI